MQAFELGQLIRGINRQVKQYINHALKDYSISEGQFEYFVLIYQNEGINQNNLAEIMNLNKASVTKAIKILMNEALVDRQVNDNDKRNYGLYISKKGQQLVSVFNDISSYLSETLMSDISQEDLEAFKILLVQLNQNSLKLKQDDQ